MTRLEKFFAKPITKNGMTLQEAICMIILVGTVAWLCIQRH